ncbi:hypothetical protein EJD97_019208, partial [Solanum chilense]
GLYLLEICQNAAGSTDLAKDLCGHDGPSWIPSSHTCAISCAALFITPIEGMTDHHTHNGSSRVSVPKHLNSWNSVSNYFSDLHEEPAGRTVMATTVRHALRNPTVGQNSPSSFSSCTTMPPTDSHKHDE